MSAAHDPLHRLLELEQILRSESDSGDGTDSQATRETHARRIGQLTAALRRRTDVDNDIVDALAMRLLINDCASLVSRLRALAGEAETRISAAAAPIQEIRVQLEQQEKLRLRRLAARAAQLV